MIELAFIVLLTFAQAHLVQVECPNIRCVDMLRRQAAESSTIQRFQVWRAWEYAKLPIGNQFVWPPIIDVEFQ